MKHLTVDEMLDFVSLTELNRASIVLSVTVNGHIRKCEKCLKAVRAFQILYDEFAGLSTGGSFREYLSETEKGNKQSVEAFHTVDEIDGFR